MIKFIISFCIILLFLFSCKEIQKKEIKSKVDSSLKKIENIINIDEKNNKTKSNNKNETIFYYVGEPYYIQGVKYIPQEDYNYSEIGLSTFYGKELHNIKTINNDLNKVTELLGRHKTLPIPSMVKVTNLENGLSINIKIVDRHDDNASLLQVSRKVAQLLGFYKNQIATVKVEILSDASKQWKSVSNSLNEIDFNETISSAPTENVSISDIDTQEIDQNINNQSTLDNKPIELNLEQVSEFNLYLKIFNFNNYTDIKNTMDSLLNDLKYTSEKNGSNYDIIIGPVEKTEINNLVSYFISKGYKENKIILE